MEIDFQALLKAVLTANGVGLIAVLTALAIQFYHYFLQIKADYEPFNMPLDYEHPPPKTQFAEPTGFKKILHKSLLISGLVMIFGSALVNLIKALP